MPKTKIIDISLPIDKNIVVWPGTPPFETLKLRDIIVGDDSDDTRISASVHTGTHIDAPAHFLPKASTIDAIDIERFITDVYVVDLKGKSSIDVQTLRASSIPRECDALLFKTDNSTRWQNDPGRFFDDYVGLSMDAAKFLVERKMQLLGIDYLSIALFNQIKPVHEILLKNDVIILEGLNLADVVCGWYQLICLPQKLIGIEAAPVRAVLRAIQ